MRLINFGALSCLVLVVPSSAARAQMCNGAASFRVAPFSVGANASFADGGKSYSGELSYGHASGAFGSVSIGADRDDDLDETETSWGLGVGYSAPVGHTKKTELCPFFSVDFQTGQSIDEPGVGRAESSSRSFGLGLSIGRTLSSSTNWDIIPFGLAGYGNATLTVKGEAFGEPFAVHFTEDFLGLGLGAGFVRKKVFTIQSAIAYPVGVEGGRFSFNFGVSYNFGSRGAKSER